LSLVQDACHIISFCSMPAVISIAPQIAPKTKI